MNVMRLARLFLVATLALLTVLLVDVSGLAQCSMCRASLAGSNNAFFIRNFNIGVLVLLTPPVAIFCSIFVILKRHSGTNGQDSNEDRAAVEVDPPSRF
ncbi:MAG: hypothetical protein ACR2LM_13805 [Pyrinomonadaceae bacterium]